MFVNIQNDLTVVREHSRVDVKGPLTQTPAGPEKDLWGCFSIPKGG